MLQQHRKDLTKQGQILLIQIFNLHQLQDHSKQARNGAQCWNTGSPYCLPAKCFKTICLSPSSKLLHLSARFYINRRSFPNTDQYWTHTFCGWCQQGAPAAGWWVKPAGWGSSETRSAAWTPQAGRTGPLTWTQTWAAQLPYCQEPPPAWSVTNTNATHDLTMSNKCNSSKTENPHCNVTA